MRKILRPYQQQALDSLLKRLKETSHPLLVNASVGAGKSLIIAELLLIMERANFNVLCLTLNSTLIQQNAEAYKIQGGNAGIYCAALKAKETENLIIFASPNSVCQDIRSKGKISKKKFNLIVVDECHNISPADESTMFRRIINHYGLMSQGDSYSFRVIGLTGTPYRGKGESIIGKDQFFKEEVCNISTSWLIENNYLVRPQFGYIDKSYDFSKLHVNSMGKFNEREIQEIVDKNTRLTHDIMLEVSAIVNEKRKGAFIFAATRKHCEECLKSLPNGEVYIITGETAHEERKRILESAREGKTKYLVSVNCLNVGVDVPSFDIAVWVRPTESLVLYTQGIGRVLRLHENKQSALILDYAGNLERHGDIDDPIINEALKPHEENEKDYCIPCYTCGTSNTVHARRCIGIKDNKRCEHYFEFKPCYACELTNDTTSRHCRGCKTELIDPNAKLKSQAATKDTYEFIVKKARYGISENMKDGTAILRAAYQTVEGRMIYEAHYTSTEKSKNIFYGKFIRECVTDASKYYPCLQDPKRMRTMLSSIKTPRSIVCFKDEERWKIRKKVFYDSL